MTAEDATYDAYAKVVEDIQAAFGYMPRRMYREMQKPFYAAYGEAVRRQTGLYIGSEVRSRLWVEMLDHSLRRRLEELLKACPGILRSSSYPHNIIRWVAEQLRVHEREDVFGSYDPLTPRIELYWLPIKLVAEREAWRSKDLIAAVTVRQWARAYLHWGRDDSGQSLGYGVFECFGEVYECFAQYWTHYALKTQPEFSHAFRIYLSLSKNQLPAYRAHTLWIPPHDFDGYGYDAYRRPPSAEYPTLPPFLLDLNDAIRRIFSTAVMPNPTVSLKEVDALVADAARERLGEVAAKVF